MKKGDLVKVVNPGVPPPIEVGDLAILTEIDWDHRHYPDGIPDMQGRKNVGRGYFFFPSKPDVHKKFQREGKPLGVMLLFNNFEVISEAG